MLRVIYNISRSGASGIEMRYYVISTGHEMVRKKSGNFTLKPGKSEILRVHFAHFYGHESCCICRILFISIEQQADVGFSRKSILFAHYRKIPKISPGAYIFQRPFLRGLSTDGNLRFKTDWASLIVGSKFTVFALFYFIFGGQFSKYKPLGGLIFGGAI